MSEQADDVHELAARYMHRSAQQRAYVQKRVQEDPAYAERRRQYRRDYYQRTRAKRALERAPDADEQLRVTEAVAQAYAPPTPQEILGTARYMAQTRARCIECNEARPSVLIEGADGIVCANCDRHRAVVDAIAYVQLNPDAYLAACQRTPAYSHAPRIRA